MWRLISAVHTRKHACVLIFKIKIPRKPCLLTIKIFFESYNGIFLFFARENLVVEMHNDDEINKEKYTFRNIRAPFG